MNYNGVAGMVRCALWLEVQVGLSIEGIGRGALDRQDSCRLEACGKYLAYDIFLDGGFLFLSASLMDEANPPEALLSVGDTKDGWQLICRIVRALERNGVRSLQRPIEAGSGPNGFVFG